jgi:hypothetical protein
MKTSHNTAYYRLTPAAPAGQSAGVAGTANSVAAVRGSTYSAPRQPSVLEALHPEIIQAVTLLWGYPEMNLYFEKLWLDDGSGAPIAPEAMSELMLLAGVHRWLLPQRPARSMAAIYDPCHAPNRPKDLWDDIPRRR